MFRSYLFLGTTFTVASQDAPAAREMGSHSTLSTSNWSFNKLLSTIYLLEILVLVLKCYYNLSHKSKDILQCSCAAQTKLL